MSAYGFTPEEQAARDIACTLRGVRSVAEAPRGIGSDVLRPTAPDSADALAWLAHAARPDRLEARCAVHVVTDSATGAQAFDVGRMVAELAGDIARCRASFEDDGAKAAK